MIPPLYKHQEVIKKEDRKWFGNWQGTGSAKTRSCLEIAKGNTLVIAPKQQVLDRTWEKNNERFETKVALTVISKERFRRDWEILPYFQTVIVDEAHTLFGVYPETTQKKGVESPKTSLLFQSLKNYIAKHKPERFYLCSATPASKPMHVYAIGTLYGQTWNFFRFREKFYFQRKIGRYMRWLQRDSKELKEELASIVQRLGYTGRLQDFFDVPDQTHKEVFVDLTESQKREIKKIQETVADPMSRRAKIRTIENGCLYGITIQSTDYNREKIVRSYEIFESEKLEYIVERAEEFPKLLIFANYLAQIEAIRERLEKEGYTVLTLTGETKDRGSIVERAEKAERCIVIAQCGISSGYELKTISCVIFASKSYKYLDYDQGIGRVLRADALKKNLYIHLVVRGGVDHDCHTSIMSGKDFQEKIHDTIEN